MIAKFMNVLGISETDAFIEEETRRAYPRRMTDRCIGVIDGQAMPVLDWSLGGVRVFGETRTYAVGQNVDVTLKFHMEDKMIDIQQKAQVVRKSAEVFALQFAPLSNDVEHTFQKVIDNFNAEEFASSQA